MGKVYVVHCVDTEGPLYESLEATFQRIEDMTGISLEPSRDTLKKIQNKEAGLGKDADLLAEIFSERLLSYNRDWGELDRMLDALTAEEFRMNHADPEDRGWKFTWFVMDHADYVLNPRNKAVGYNAVWDHYQEYFRLHQIKNDEFQWHVHPAGIYREGNRCGTSYLNSPHVFQSLSRRLIDRGFFPNAFRAGVHTERPDSHWFLEQYIPYDFSNQAIRQTENEQGQMDISDGRFGDWRRAPSDWGWYHPSHDDYQIPGNCRRTVFRCLNAGTRLRLITQKEVSSAFERAAGGEDTVMAFCDHDFRDMSYDIDEVYRYIRNASLLYPDVEWVNATAAEAARAVLKETCGGIKLSCRCFRLDGRRTRLEVRTDRETFGPQPFFAVKMRGGTYRAENLDLQVPRREWSFVFDDDSIRPDDVISIGIAVNSRDGSGALSVFTPENEVKFQNKW